MRALMTPSAGNAIFQVADAGGRSANFVLDTASSGMYITGMEKGTGTAAAGAVTINTVAGVITYASTLGVGSTENIQLTNSRLAAGSVILANILTMCKDSGDVSQGLTVQYVQFTGASPAIINVKNVGAAACDAGAGREYKIAFYVIV
eukprot:jgi/Mesvir1/27928/Mv20146-RA.1